MEERFTLVPALILGMVFSIFTGPESKITAAIGSAMTDASRNNAQTLTEKGKRPDCLSPFSRDRDKITIDNTARKKMKKLTIILTVLMVFILALTATGCIVVGEGNGEDEGSRTTRTYDFTDFTEVEIGNAFRLEVIPSDDYSITITAGQNILDKLRVNKSGGRLEIDLTGWIFSIRGNMEARVTMPVLEGLYLSGASRTTAKGFSSDRDFRGEISGASSLDMDLTCGKCDLEVSGASKITGMLHATDTDFKVTGASSMELDGTGADSRIIASGASHLQLRDFEVEDADLELSGASSGNVNVTGRLDVELSGASSLRYEGDPELGSVNTSGGSSFREA